MNTPNRPGAIKREDCKNKIRAQVSLISRTHARIMASEMTHRVEFEIKHTSNAKLGETLLWPRFRLRLDHQVQLRLETLLDQF